MSDLDTLAKVYVKFYICQIYASTSYPIWKKGQKEYSDIVTKYIPSTTSIDIPIQPTTEQKEDNNDIIMNIDFEDSSPKKPLIPSLDPEKYLKKLFVFKSKIFSRVEIMGLVIQIQTHLQGETSRKVLYVDDTTGIIQCILWKNKLENIYNKTEQDITTGTFLRILGQVDYFANKFEINVERYQIVNSFNQEYLFHLTMQQNHKAIEEALISGNNIKDDLTKAVIPEGKGFSSLLNIRVNTRDIYKSSNLLLKEFANRLLAFFQNYKIDCSREENGFTQIKVKDLVQNKRIGEMICDFFGKNANKEKCIQNVFTLYFEPNVFGKIIYSDEVKDFASAELEIKIEQKRIVNEILDFVEKKTREDSTKGAFFGEIQQFMNSNYGNFFTSDYVKFILKHMNEKGLIMDLTPNSYATPYNLV